MDTAFTAGLAGRGSRDEPHADSLERVPLLWNRNTLSILSLAHVLVGPLRRAQRGKRTGVHPRIKSGGMLRRNMR
jgi:hypothetical protein